MTASGEPCEFHQDFSDGDKDAEPPPSLDVGYAAIISPPQSQDSLQDPSRFEATVIRRSSSGIHSLGPFPRPKLCQRCQDIFAKVLELLGHLLTQEPIQAFEGPGQHITPLTHLKAAPETGCPHCQIWLEELKNELPSHVTEQMYIDFTFKLKFCLDQNVGLGWKMTSLLRCEVRHDRPGEPETYGSVLSYTSRVLPGREANGEQDSSSVPRAPATVIREWLSECDKTHHECRPRNGAELPTRLMAVGLASGEDPRLVVTKHQPAETDHCWDYVALSHCWGKRLPRSRTIRQNLKDHQNCIPFDSLEQTFKDAVTITRDLGYKYLWIDTLCIIQDDNSDWQTECSKMGDVYANACVTIAACHAKDADSGFLFQISDSIDMQLYKDDDVIGAIKYRQLDTEADGETGPPQGYLAQRAWTFQERLLSRRMVYFGGDQMFFECRSHIASEVPLTTDWYPIGNLPKNIPWLGEAPTTPMTAVSLATPVSFYLVAHQYTHCHLSFGDDILPALSAIAKQFSDWTRDQYFAGHWAKNFIVSLAWTCDAFETPMAPSETVTLRIPSWSWASANCAVAWSLPFTLTTYRESRKSSYSVDERGAHLDGTIPQRNDDETMARDNDGLQTTDGHDGACEFPIPRRPRSRTSQDVMLPKGVANSGNSGDDVVEDKSSVRGHISEAADEGDPLSSTCKKRRRDASPEDATATTKRRKTAKGKTRAPKKQALGDKQEDQGHLLSSSPAPAHVLSSHPINDSGVTFEELAEVIHIKAPPLGIDKFGQVDGGCCVLRGRTQEFTLGVQDGNVGSFVVQPLQEWASRRPRRSRRRKPPDGQARSLEQPPVLHLDRRHSSAAERGSQPLTALLLGQSRYLADGDFYFALALELVSDEAGEMDTYRRIGLLSSLYKDDSDGWEWINAGTVRTVRIE